MENEIVEQRQNEQALNSRSEILVESKFFPDLQSAAQAKVKVWIGRSLGLSEFQSLTGIYITLKGQIGLAAITMGTMVKSSEKYDYTIDKLDEKECSISFFRITGEEKELLGVSTFTEKDAAKCGLVNKDTYKSFPRNMLMCRALANGCRWYTPEIISGCYATEELNDIEIVQQTKTIEITKEGEVKNGEAKLSEQIPISNDSISSVEKDSTGDMVQN